MPVTGSRAALNQMIQRLRQVGTEGARRISAQVAQETKMLVTQTFQKGVSPEGQAWAPLAFRSGQPLRDTGRLATSITVTHSGFMFTVGTNVAYAAVHQYGATITVKNKRSLYSSRQRQFFGRSVVIPARPFFPTGDLPAAWRTSLNDAAVEALELFFG